MPRRLALVLGDQLDISAGLLDTLDPARDAIVMIEAREEATYLRQHKKRLVLFFAAMRHFAEALRARGFTVHYHALDGEAPAASLAAGAARHEAGEIHVTEPGDARVLEALRSRFPGLVIHDDGHFLTPPGRFAELSAGRRRFVLEDFYRARRRDTGWLMQGDAPEGGAWNYDRENRKSFGRAGPGTTPGRPESAPDATTRAVMAMVERIFPDAPGSTQGFAEPVTRRAALAHLRDFVERRLPRFGDHQDAIATGHATLWHARLSTSLNLKLISPREVCEAALEAYGAGAAPLNAVEGFLRQVLGWREFVREIYRAEMPGYARRNALGAEAALPGFFWTGETEMACLADAGRQLLDQGYAHHIQRLMVFGLFAMQWGAHPLRVHDWHMEMYLDAVDWVSLPNVLGMSQHADGGLVGTKPYCASGAYIDRMSDACGQCRFDPRAATGARACPFTTLYWSFLDRHRERFSGNRRMAMQLRNLERKADELPAIRKAEMALHRRLG
ncbi:cryptochrome/photolyase family protein [Paralimibaculum aggregatum]|uniref:Cryptochrome/photolyase family protein n=1 Tax=Paralimibaculum aggregatum TaxID=3036245 RepID=A0ABQ6LRP2_9RHOB|nr:cryptochrome/photolyase family protein [Limibaculum sp. NKW23]GMG84883.1 cryptochrome/photolyase family protein [Limibaculum sp. NKW23]